jgi:dephospho-CoA kinase
MVLFGIIGKKFSGKSVVSRIFRKNFIPIVDLDEMYKSIFLPGNRGHEKIIRNVGEDVVNYDGSISMQKLSLLICKEQWIRNIVDDILDNEFSLIIDKLEDVFEAHDINIAGIESYILGMNNISKKLSFTIYMNSDIDNRINRMVRANIPNLVINKIIKNEEEYDKNSSRYNVDNNSTIEELERKCENLIKKLKGKYNFEKK